MSESGRRFPDWLLERVALGELPDEQLAELRREIEADAEANARLEALSRSDAEILARYPAERMTREIEARRRRLDAKAEMERREGRGWRRGLALTAPLLAGATVLLLAVLPVTQRSVSRNGSGAAQPAGSAGLGVEQGAEPARLKGGAQLIVYRRSHGHEARLEPGASAAPGDLLQLYYRAGNARFGVIVSIDGRGTVTGHFTAGAKAAPLQPGGPVPLPSSYELDDAPGFERFWFVAADHPFATEPVLDAAAQLARTGPRSAATAELTLPPELSQVSFLVRKGERP